MHKIYTTNTILQPLESKFSSENPRFIDKVSPGNKPTNHGNSPNIHGNSPPVLDSSPTFPVNSMHPGHISIQTGSKPTIYGNTPTLPDNLPKFPGSSFHPGLTSIHSGNIPSYPRPNHHGNILAFPDNMPNYPGHVSFHSGDNYQSNIPTFPDNIPIHPNHIAFHSGNIPTHQHHLPEFPENFPGGNAPPHLFEPSHDPLYLYTTPSIPQTQPITFEEFQQHFYPEYPLPIPSQLPYPYGVDVNYPILNTVEVLNENDPNDPAKKGWRRPFHYIKEKIKSFIQKHKNKHKNKGIYSEIVRVKKF